MAALLIEEGRIERLEVADQDGETLMTYRLGDEQAEQIRRNSCREGRASEVELIDDYIDWANKLTSYATDEDWDRVVGEIAALPAEEHGAALLGLVKLRAAGPGASEGDVQGGVHGRR